MSFSQLVSAFGLFGPDVLLLALGVTLLTSLLKKTVLKTCNKKWFVALPFLVGTLLFAVYRAILLKSPAPFGTDIASTLEGGFGCGCAATLYYVLYEKFFEKDAASPLLPLLDFLPEDRRKEAADALWKGVRGLGKEEAAAFFRESLNTYSDVPMSEDELTEIAEVLAAFVGMLQKK